VERPHSEGRAAEPGSSRRGQATEALRGAPVTGACRPRRPKSSVTPVTEAPSGDWTRPGPAARAPACLPQPRSRAPGPAAWPRPGRVPPALASEIRPPRPTAHPRPLGPFADASTSPIRPAPRNSAERRPTALWPKPTARWPTAFAGPRPSTPSRTPARSPRGSLDQRPRGVVAVVAAPALVRLRPAPLAGTLAGRAYPLAVSRRNPRSSDRRGRRRRRRCRGRVRGAVGDCGGGSSGRGGGGGGRGRWGG
jgi:hypothetical protein